MRERDILRKLNSPFIVRFVDYFEEEFKYSNIVLEYCEVNKYLFRKKSKINNSLL